MRLKQLLRSVYAWLGFLVMPWIIAIGLTGFYLNHEDAVLAVIASDEVDFSSFERLPANAKADEKSAMDLAAALWPGAAPAVPEVIDYHGEPAYSLNFEANQLILLQASGYYFLKTPYTRTAYRADGTYYHTKYYWSRIFTGVPRAWLVGEEAGHTDRRPRGPRHGGFRSFGHLPVPLAALPPLVRQKAPAG